MEITYQPTFNTEILEGAVEQMLSVCGVLSDAALNDFCCRFAKQKEKTLPRKYATTYLLPRMVRYRKIYQTADRLFSINPALASNTKGLNAFWVFLEVMENVDIRNVIPGPYPAQMSYISNTQNNRIYHIVHCEGDGSLELGAAALMEMDVMRRTKKHNTGTEERFIFIFTSEENMRRAPLNLESPCYFCVIKYPNQANGIPDIKFCDPKTLH